MPLTALDAGLAAVGLRAATSDVRPLAGRLAGARRLMAYQVAADRSRSSAVGRDARAFDMTIVAAIAAPFVAGATRLVTGVTANWIGCPPSTEQRIYFANHTSHGDFLLIWTALPPRLRATTRPVAGSDYWCSGRVRRFVGQDVFNAVLVDRDPPKTATGRWIR